jgi:signal peptidase II
MIDSAFYGLIFTNSDYHCATGPAKLVAMGQGYSSFLHGKVVDMLFFPLWRDTTGNVVFFQPVFNIADSAITVGVISILLFHRQYFSGNDEQTPSLSENSAVTPPDQLEVSELENTEDIIETEETPKRDEEKKED